MMKECRPGHCQLPLLKQQLAEAMQRNAELRRQLDARKAEPPKVDERYGDTPEA